MTPTPPSGGNREQPAAKYAPELVVGRKRHTNTAAKFWAGMLAEAIRGHPSCTRMEFVSSIGQPLDSNLLHPERALSDAVRRYAQKDLRQAIRQTLVEMALLGAPAPVQFRLLAGRRVLLPWQPLPDFVDTDVFPYLLVWLLEWAGIPELLWNNRSIEGRFEAEDRGLKRQYSLTFELQTEHLSEGLYRQTLALHPTFQ
jgi:hypothetical protein